MKYTLQLLQFALLINLLLVKCEEGDLGSSELANKTGVTVGELSLDEDTSARHAQNLTSNISEVPTVENKTIFNYNEHSNFKLNSTATNIDQEDPVMSQKNENSSFVIKSRALSNSNLTGEIEIIVEGQDVDPESVLVEKQVEHLEQNLINLSKELRRNGNPGVLIKLYVQAVLIEDVLKRHNMEEQPTIVREKAMNLAKAMKKITIKSKEKIFSPMDAKIDILTKELDALKTTSLSESSEETLFYLRESLVQLKQEFRQITNFKGMQTIKSSIKEIKSDVQNLRAHYTPKKLKLLLGSVQKFSKLLKNLYLKIAEYFINVWG